MLKKGLILDVACQGRVIDGLDLPNEVLEMVVAFQGRVTSIDCLSLRRKGHLMILAF